MKKNGKNNNLLKFESLPFVILCTALILYITVLVISCKWEAMPWVYAITGVACLLTVLGMSMLIIQLAAEKRDRREENVSLMVRLNNWHVRSETMTRLKRDGIYGVVSYLKADPLYVNEDGKPLPREEYGVFCVISDDWEGSDEIPDDLRACIQYAESKGAKWIMFDYDEPTIPALKDYWEEEGE